MLVKNHKQTQAEKMIPLIAKKIGEDHLGVQNLMRTILEDSHVAFVWSLWGEEDVDDSEDEETKTS